MLAAVLVALLATQPIQARKYSLGHELTLSFGSMPIDPFEKGWSAGLSYTVHFGPVWSWEIFNATAAYLVPTALRDDLIEGFGREPDEFAAPRAMITTGVVAAPLYGKVAFLDDTVLHHAFFVGLHAGVVFGSRQTIVDTLTDVRPSAGLGVGYRLFLSESVSMRIDVRDFVSFRRAFAANDPARFEQVLIVTVALALSSGGAP